MDRDRDVRGEEAGVDEGPQEQEQRRWVAAGIRDPVRSRERPALVGGELGQAVDPSRGDPVRGAGVEQLGFAFLRPRGGLPSGVVG